MSHARTEAIVLRGVDFGETSRIVTFLCPDRGRMACMAKGFRRKASALPGLLDTFNVVELQYYWRDSRSVQILGEASLVDAFPEIKQDLDKVSYGALLIEVAYKASCENAPSQELYRVLVDGLRELARREGDVKAFATWHVLRLLAAAGYAPELDRCTDCGTVVTDTAGFALESGIRCAGCRADYRLSGPELTALRDLMTVETANAGSSDLFGLVCAYGRRQLESDFRSTRVLNQIYGS